MGGWSAQACGTFIHPSLTPLNRHAGLLSRLKLTNRPMTTEAAPAAYMAGRIVSHDPLITFSGFNPQFPLGLLSVAPDLLGTRPGLHLLHYPWTLENGRAARVAKAIAAARRDFPQSRVVMMASNEIEALAYGATGEEVILANVLTLTDERVWRPYPRQSGSTFDAVYVARLDPGKRHELARSLESIDLIYGHSIEKDGGIERVSALLPQAHFANQETGRYRRMSQEEVAIRLAQSDVGLCLSAEEGCMRASMEYLLAGLPVVSTRSIGGRDRYFVGAYCRVVEPDPDMVAKAVAELRARNFDRRLVRAHIGELLSFERHNLIGTLNALTKSTWGVDEMFKDLGPLLGATGPTVPTKTLYDQVLDAVTSRAQAPTPRSIAHAPTVTRSDRPALPTSPRPEEKPAHEPRFVAIIAKARAGTNLLRSLLRQEAWIDCVDEVFNDTTQAALKDHFGPFLARSIASRPQLEPSAKIVTEILDHYFTHLRSRHGGSKTTLLDVKQEELRMLDWPSIRLSDPPRLLSYMRDHGFRFIRLRRRNLLAQMASLRLAFQTQVWVKSTAAPINKAPTKIHIDLDTLLSEFETREREEAQVDRWLGDGAPSLTLFYEDLSTSSGSLADGPRARLNHFLRRPLSTDVVAQTRKLAPPLSELIENYDEVARALTGTQFERFLE